MKINFYYNLEYEFVNFKNSFNSLNHISQSPRQQEFFSLFSELTPDNSKQFVENYITTNKLDTRLMLKQIEDQWRIVELEFFKRADRIFKTELPIEIIDVYLTIHDRCSYNFEKKLFFVHLNLPAANKTMMHELWHFYFYYTVGKSVLDKYGKQIFNDLKESLTVLLNVEFADLLGEVKDKGYSQHSAIREYIVELYKKEKDIYQVIESTLKKFKK